ncbi:MAG: hypothetical protein JL50_00040 [Peptococcaceae bacterium BICA1-7]|nr:MAG: hypothetical protein JL50_00040 [Peptococcaceae bacterium BICA1-7]HBV98228.1 hypothetical protein [Desulfotomaculum sp.]
MKKEIVRVNSPGLMQAFSRVPSLVYPEGEIPPSAACMDKFSPLNPVLEHLIFANFVALKDNRPVGRITASVDKLDPRREEGFWGCFECEENPETAEVLLDAAAYWLKKKGCSVMIGPASLNTNEQVGLLIRGFEYPPLQDMPYNPPYYQGLVEASGLDRAHDLECFNWELPMEIPGEMKELKPIRGLRIRPVNYMALMRDAGILMKFHNSAMSGLWGHIPLTYNDARGFMESLARRVPPQLFLICEVEGKLAGLLLSIPHRNRNGLFVRHAVGGVMPEFRKRGIHLHILKESFRRCHRLGLTRGEGSQVAESNSAVKKSVINPIFGGETIKAYRVYKKSLY